MLFNLIHVIFNLHFYNYTKLYVNICQCSCFIFLEDLIMFDSVCTLNANFTAYMYRRACVHMGAETFSAAH